MKHSQIVVAFFVFITSCISDSEVRVKKQDENLESSTQSLKLSKEQLEFINSHKKLETFSFHRGEFLRKKAKASKMQKGTVLYKECRDENCELKIALKFQEGRIVQTDNKYTNRKNKYVYDSTGLLIKNGAFDLMYQNKKIVLSSNGIEREGRKISYLGPNCKEAVLGLDRPRVTAKSCYDTKNRLVSIITTTYSSDEEDKILGVVTQKITYKGDDIVNTTFTSIGGDGEVILDANNRFEYDNGLIVKKYISYANMKRIDSTHFTYKVLSQTPLVIEKYESKGKRTKSKSFTYYFDEQGKLVKYTDHFRNHLKFKLEYIGG